MTTTTTTTATHRESMEVCTKCTQAHLTERELKRREKLPTIYGVNLRGEIAEHQKKINVQLHKFSMSFNLDFVGEPVPFTHEQCSGCGSVDHGYRDLAYLIPNTPHFWNR